MTSVAKAEVSTLFEGSRNVKTGSALLASFLFLLAIIFLGGCESGNKLQVQKLSGMTMGTTYHITVVGLPNSVSGNDLKNSVDERLVLINQQMSTYIDDSELSLLNNNGSPDAVVVSAALFEVLSLSDSISRLSDGAFDVTIGPLIDLWGFGPVKQKNRLPTDEEILQAKQATGFDGITLDPQTVTVQRNKPLRIDLSAVAKGYGVDAVAQLLNTLGYDNYLVEIGGEIRLKGHNAAGDHWRIGIEKPMVGMMQTSRQAVAMTDVAVATSGDYRNYFEVNGVRYSHTIDPRTAWPITHNLVSVTVLAETAAQADALATAFNVMGLETALPLANVEGIAAFFIIQEGDVLRDVASEAFKAYLDSNE